MRRTATITTGLLLGAALLGGCGGDDGKDGGEAKASSAYCQNLKAAKGTIDEFSAAAVPDDETISGLVDQVADVADEAPSSIKPEWELFGETLQKLIDALDDAGVQLEDAVAALSGGKVPEGKTLAQMEDLGMEIQGLASADFLKAAKAIDKNAKSECALSLSLS